RVGKRTAEAAFRIAEALVDEELIGEDEALARVWDVIRGEPTTGPANGRSGDSAESPASRIVVPDYRTVYGADMRPRS
ncbi:hypothetical protein ACWELV_28570, partial [Streptomyces mirabilis]